MDETHDSDRIEGAPHPRDAADLFGHRGAEAELLEAHRSTRLSHAWLIGGPRGIGKATLAWRFARFLLAHPEPRDPAVRDARDLSVLPDHPVWGRLRGGAAGDVAVLRREWNPKTKKFFGDIRVDDVRNALHLFQRSSGAGGFRICIVDSADDLNRSSANALLKVLEEPPPRSLFLIVAHQPAQMMPTILSRCRKLTLAALDPADVLAAVRASGHAEGELSAADWEAVARRSGGSVGRTLHLLDETRLGLDRDLQAELDRLPEIDWRALHRLVDRLGRAEAETPGGVLMEAVLGWIDARVQAAAQAGLAPRRLAPLAEVWDKIRASSRDAEDLNLDKRPLLLSVFADLAHATRAARRF